MNVALSCCYKRGHREHSRFFFFYRVMDASDAACADTERERDVISTVGPFSEAVT